MENRIQYIDNSKALAIIFMIFAHCNVIYRIPYAFHLIYLFHMPLFMIVSGYLFKPSNKPIPFLYYLKKYIYPYFIGSILTIAAIVVVSFCANYNIAGQVKRVVVASLFGDGLFYGRGENVIFGDMPGIGVIWFLWGLLWAKIAYDFITKHFSDLLVLIISVFLFGMAVVSSKFIVLPFSIQSGLASVIFLYIGQRFKCYFDAGKHPSKASITVMLLIVCCSLLYYMKYHHTIILASCRFDTGLYDVFISSCIVLCIFMFFKYVRFSSGWIGQHTLEIMVANQPVTFFLLGCQDVSTRIFNVNGGGYINIGSVLEVAFAFSATLVLAYLLDKFKLLKFPNFINK